MCFPVCSERLLGPPQATDATASTAPGTLRHLARQAHSGTLCRPGTAQLHAQSSCCTSAAHRSFRHIEPVLPPASASIIVAIGHWVCGWCDRSTEFVLLVHLSSHTRLVATIPSSGSEQLCFHSFIHSLEKCLWSFSNREHAVLSSVATGFPALRKLPVGEAGL